MNQSLKLGLDVTDTGGPLKDFQYSCCIQELPSSSEVQLQMILDSNSMLKKEKLFSEPLCVCAFLSIKCLKAH